MLPLVYGAQELDIPLTISYSLDTDYLPAGPDAPAEPITIPPETLQCLPIAGIYLLGGGRVWLIIRRVRRSS